MIDFESKYTGEEVEAFLDQMSSGQSDIFVWHWNMANSGQLAEGEYDKLKDSRIVLISAGLNDHHYIVPTTRAEEDNSIVFGIHYAEVEGLSNFNFSFSENGTWTMSTEELPFVTEEQLDGKQDKIEDLDTIRSGAEKGATALQSIPSEYVTESELSAKGYATTSALNDKVDKVSGKGLSTEDFTTALKTKLEGLNNYNDTEISNAVSSLQTQLNTLVSGDANDAINSFNEIIAFLDGVKDTQDLSSIIASIEQQIAGKMDKVTLATVATSGSYNDLSNKPTIPAEQVNADWNATSGKAQILNKPTIPTAVTESTVSGWGFTKNTGTYSKPSGGIPKTDLASAVQTSLGKADTALQSYTEQYKGTVTGVKINGTTKNPSNGVVDLGTVITSHQDISGKQDKLVSGTNIKTINGASILGSGNITIEGGSGGVSQEAFDSLVNTVDNIDADVAELTKGAVITHILGDYRYAENTDGMVSREGVIYALPDSVNDNSSEDDIIATANTLKTINGQSLLGSGDITISGGGGEDIRFFTDFTVEKLISYENTGATISMDATDLIEAARNNKLICVPWRDYEKGYIVASYGLKDKAEYLILEAAITINGVQYSFVVARIGSSYVVRDNGVLAFSPRVEYIDGTEAYIELSNNTTYVCMNDVSYLFVSPAEDLFVGATVRFTPNSAFSLESIDVLWANGQTPEIEPYYPHELSITQDNNYYLLAVLTKFKIA